jgi:hypothetical protein
VNDAPFNRSIASNQECEKALRYLASTDESCANARALQLYLESKEKTILAMSMVNDTGTVQEKDSRARTCAAYLEWLEQYREAVADYELQRNKRKRAELTVEVWRSQNANLRKGNI